MIGTAFKAAFACLLLTTPAVAQSSKVLIERQIGGWQVKKLETPKHGISCQALRCNVRDCGKAQSSMLLWGSADRKAVTPMVEGEFSFVKARDATLTIGGLTVVMEQREQAVAKRYIAKNQADDARIMAELARNRNEMVSFKTERGEARFRLTGLERVLNFFERQCGILKP